MRKYIQYSIGIVLSACFLVIGSPIFDNASAAAAGFGHGPVNHPVFRVDHKWPKPLPYHWEVGQIAGMTVDQNDHIWILQRPRTLSDSEAWATDAFTTGCPTGTPHPDSGTCDDGSKPVAVDAFGHPRPFGPEANCCVPAPSVLEFNTKGELIQAWGGPVFRDPAWNWPSPNCRPENGCQWPANEHGIYVDDNGYVYIAGNGSGDGSFSSALNDRGADGQVLKFTQDGQFLLEVGRAGASGPASNDTDGGLNGTPQLYLPADMAVDPTTNELYISDGYGNHRVVVVDASNGLYKRHWGAFGQNPINEAAADTAGPYGADRDAGVVPPYFRTPVHCVRIVNNKVYVCDRVNDRLQVFDKNKVGKVCDNAFAQKRNKCGFLTEKSVEPDTLGNGSVWDVATSSDRSKSCLYVLDGTNENVDILNRRTLQIVGQFGRAGHHSGEFHWVHRLATDSRGNIYTGEVDIEKRIQKFRRLGPIGCR